MGGAIQEIFRRHGPAYLAEFGKTLPGSHARVIEAIIDCRSAACGSVLYQCEDCGEPHVAARCCGNRHCPVCQQGKAEAWLARQLDRQLPTPYFMLTFTVPAPLREFLRGHPREGYGALFAASAGAIKALAADDQHLGADTPGFFGVLHTWGRPLQYHPHIHYVIPGGGFHRADGRWHAANRGFFLPVRALSPIFRAKFRDAMDAAGLLAEIDPAVWTVDWNVNCQSVGDAQASLEYLSRYVFKVAISEGRILRADDTEVVFRYRKVNSQRERTMALPPAEFIRRFLQHVLPTGFMKVRYFGFLSPSCSMSIKEVKARIELARGFAVSAAEAADNQSEHPTPRRPICPHCGGRLRCCGVLLPRPLGSRDLSRPREIGGKPVGASAGCGSG
ncbi:MAG: putative transposase [Candidatus Accumulibacter sp. SK-11]|nr:MAG: putative transposase [Candidatus Accumulibacter sp. SK-11]HRL77456.1 IS91 family transposase [Candidatus Accumulibacter phosphatis]